MADTAVTTERKEVGGGQGAAAGGAVKKQVKLTAAARPQVTVHDVYGRGSKRTMRMPDVLLAPIRTDVVNAVHTQMAKNDRQPYAVKVGWGPKGIVAGHQVSAASWGTGRAVSRVPRVRGGGTHRAGQGAYANMCRGGRMFAPTKIWRKWHKKINKNQKRYAVCSALAASAVPSLVMARGHRVQAVSEIPLVVEDDFQRLTKTRDAVRVLQALRLGSELRRCKRRYKRAGKGKGRNRRWTHRLGPLIIFKEDRGIVRAARNIRGVDFCQVGSINLLKLAPGGHVGRLVVFTESAFRELSRVYGTFSRTSSYKKNYHMPRALMYNSDLNRIINSEEIQSAIRPKRIGTKQEKKRNPLKHPGLYARLNPLFAQQLKELKDGYKKDSRPRTTKLLKPLKKKQRIATKLTEEQKKQMQGYWDLVFGTDQKIFKTRDLLAKERMAVRRQKEIAEREKLGLDLKDAMEAAKLAQQGGAVKSSGKADDSDSD